MKNKNFNGAFYGRQTPTRYEINKEKAREEGIEFSITFSQYDYDYLTLSQKANYFTKLAKRYGLIKEFRENGII